MHKILTQRDDDCPLSFDSLESAMQFLAKQNPDLPQSDIMGAAARLQDGALVRKYNTEGERAIAKAETEAMDATRRPPAVREFESLVAEIARRDKCPRTTATRRARSEDPELFARFQAA